MTNTDKQLWAAAVGIWVLIFASEYSAKRRELDREALARAQREFDRANPKR